MELEIFFKEDIIYQISPQKKLLLISNLEHSHLIDRMRQ